MSKNTWKLVSINLLSANKHALMNANKDIVIPGEILVKNKVLTIFLLWAKNMCKKNRNNHKCPYQIVSFNSLLTHLSSSDCMSQECDLITIESLSINRFHLIVYKYLMYKLIKKYIILDSGAFYFLIWFLFFINIIE